MAFDLTNLQILKANSISLISFRVGLIFVTNFNFLLLKTIESFSCSKNELSNISRTSTEISKGKRKRGTIKERRGRATADTGRNSSELKLDERVRDEGAVGD